MQKKITIAVVLAVLAGAGFYGWTILRWTVIFRMKVQDVFEKKVGRFPESPTVIAIPDMVKEAAQAAHVPTENLTTTMHLEGRVMGPVTMWFLCVSIGDGSHTPIEVDHRVESQDRLFNDSENLEQHGIKLLKK